MPGEQLLTYRPLPGARLNMSHPLAKGLVGCWLLNESGGLTAMDLSPYANHGKLVGFDAPPKRAFDGLTFDGTDDYISVPHSSSLSLATALSIDAFVFLPTLPAVAGFGIISKRNAITTNYCLGITHVATAGRLFAYDGGVGGVFSDSPITAARWHHVVFTQDGSTITFHLNGIADGSQALTLGTTHTDPLFIGQSKAATELFAGRIGLIRLWKDRILYLQEIKELYLSPYAPMGMKLFL